SQPGLVLLMLPEVFTEQPVQEKEDSTRFFDAIEHGWLMKFVEHRVADPGMINLIRKWLSIIILFLSW
ncbi:MAG: hypothetical protein D3917_09475, partial [Candidatus Electrothrix sp. AX5]|nr:hypothetical protein [Candidatus Electrothrix sp. AX5]